MSGGILHVGKSALGGYLWLLCLLFTVAASSAEECDKTKCSGPLAYYETLKCMPIYKKPSDCCATRYDCSQIKGRSKEKCYVNDNVYEVGERLKEEDSNPCDIGCTCLKGFNDVATFNCAVVDCFHGPMKPGCYHKRSALECCPGEEVCPENPDDRPKCIVEGKTYLDGEAFSVNDTDLNCCCQAGYKGENIEPFCVKPKHDYCGAGFRDAWEISANCAPVYYSIQSPRTSCSVFYRCQNEYDTVIHTKSEESNSNMSDDMMCKFGNLTMQVNDELNQATDYSSVCVKCVCEVPPLPTCQRLPGYECDVTMHPPFMNSK